jgi:hypothetical protein
MSRQTGPYRHYIPKLNLSIERYTSRVPKDGKFYVICEGQLIMGFHSLKKAEEKFRKLVKESGYKPEVPTGQRSSASDESIERYLMAKDLFWAEGPKYRKKGGRGGRGGV